jgi:hypothetical protein
MILALLGCPACNSPDVASPEVYPAYGLADASTDTFIFGRYSGFCPAGTDCTQLYKVTGYALYEDHVVYLRDHPTAIEFKKHPLPDAQYELATGLSAKIPLELLTSTTEIIGQPDAFDQGGIYLELLRDGIRKRWYLDTEPSNLPAGVRPYLQEITQVLAQLK